MNNLKKMSFILVFVLLLNAFPTTAQAENHNIIEDQSYSGDNIDWENKVPGEDYRCDEVIVTFADDVEETDVVETVASLYGCSVKRILCWMDFPGGKIAQLTILNNSSVRNTILALESHESVQYAEVNALCDLNSIRVSQSNQRTVTYNAWYQEKINLEDAWDVAKCNGDVSVAILDTGVQLNHPALLGNIDTEHARDFVNNSVLTGDVDGHGTYAAGIISAVPGNAIGITGVSYNARIIPINVYDATEHKLDNSAMVKAYQYLLTIASDVNLKVIYIGDSFENHFSAALNNIIQQAASQCIATICPAGDDWSHIPRAAETYPSDYAAAISVTATDEQDTITTNTIGGNHKDISAPGTDICTIMPTTDSTYRGIYIDGTGAAAAVAAGVAALMCASNEYLTVDQLKSCLYDTIDNHYLASSMEGIYYGEGRINAAQAVAKAFDGRWKRLSGSSRYYTMKAISEAGWGADTVETVIVATGANFPDALAGSSLAGIHESPMILTKTSSLSVQAREEIERLNPNRVIIIGAEGAVSAAAENEIKEIVGTSNVIRLQGDTRYKTCSAIYQSATEEWSRTVILATGTSSADALSISSYAYASKSPIFLVTGAQVLQPEMISAITGQAFDRAIIVGAPTVISSDLENWLKSQLGNSNVLRLYGNDRYETSSQIADWTSGQMTEAPFQPAHTLGYQNVGMARGADDNFPDALAGGAFCGINSSVFLLTRNSTLSDNYTVQNNIIPNKNDIDQGYLFGAPEVLSESLRVYLNLITMH